MIELNDVLAARSRIEGRIRRTPVVEVDAEPFAPATRAWLKLEQLQHTGSFKARGAFNRVRAALGATTTDDPVDHAVNHTRPRAGIVVASGGNAGMAFAHAAATHGLPARVFVPENAPVVKVKKLRELGADVAHVGTKYADAYEAAVRHAEETGALLCHAYDQPEMCAGNGTLGLELMEQTGGEVDTILLAVGGGGLMAGVAAAVEGRARVVGVEPANAPTLNRALAAGGPVTVDVSGVAADSLGASRLGEIAYAVASRAGVRSVLVDDDDIVEARQLIWNRYRQVVEHGTASALAALLTGAYLPAEGERVAVVLCGANTDPATLT